MGKFVSVEEAKSITGKAEATIRKIFKKASDITDNESVIIKEPYKGGYKMWIDKDYLLKELNLDTKLDTKKDVDNKYVKHLEDEIQFLRDRIKNLETEKDKDRQRQDYLIKLLGDKVNEDEKIKKLKH